MPPSLKLYKFTVSSTVLDTVKATLPAVAQAGTDFTSHFYQRMFQAHPELRNIFNQTNQQRGIQPRKLFCTIAQAATAALQTGTLPGAAIEAVCQKHCALGIQKDAYDIVGEHLIATIKETLTDDANVLAAWASLYDDIAGFLTERELEIYQQAAWEGKKEFKLISKEAQNGAGTIFRFTFESADVKNIAMIPGQYTTIWFPVSSVDSEANKGASEQPRHYTLAVQPDGSQSRLTISVQKYGTFSNKLHAAEIGSTFQFSAPFGDFILDTGNPVVLLSAGIGLTPCLAMLESRKGVGNSVWMHGARNGSLHAYHQRVSVLASSCHTWYSQPADGDKFDHKGRMDLSTVPKETLLLSDLSTQYFLCGPKEFLDEQIKALETLGVDASRLHTETFG